MKENPQWKSVLVSLVITVIGVIMMLVPFVFEMDGINGGYALAVFGLLVFTTGIIAAFVYARRARMLSAIFAGKNLLAHWTYTPDEWRSYTEKAHKEKKASNKGIVLVIAAWAIVIGVIFIIINPEDWKFPLFFCVGLIAIIAPIAYLPVLLDYRRNKRYMGEAYISRNGVYLNRVFHTWQGLGAQLESVVYEEEARSLLFTYRAPDRTGLRQYTVRVPVPRGQEKAARKIIVEFTPAGVVMIEEEQ